MMKTGSIALLAALAAWSCSDECKRPSDCRAGYTCFKGECVPVAAGDADADVPRDDATGADADADVVDNGDGSSDVPVCGCTTDGDCPASTLACTYWACNAETHCCDTLYDVPNYCAAQAGTTYCGGADWCLEGVLAPGTGSSRCEDSDPPEVDNCDLDGGVCSLTAARVCPW